MGALNTRRASSEAGVTLVEVLIATTIIAISSLSLIAAFGHISRSLQGSKAKSLAMNLAQEKVESLKNISYFRLLVTTGPVTETRVTPNFDYDNGYYPLEVPVTVGGIEFQRSVYIHKVAEDGSGALAHKDWSAADTGLKEIRVYVLWKQGNQWTHVMVRNLKDDPYRLPADATFAGNAKDNLGANLTGVKVEVLENSAWNKDTDSAGNYSFLVVSGSSYTLRASKTGYFTAYSPATLAPANLTATVNFTLGIRSSGTVAGTAYLRDHIVISQVVASTVSAGENQEYVELYNPTTFTWTISNAAFDLRYVNQNNTTVTDIDLTFRNNSFLPNAYYLIANTGTVTAAGLAVTADAVYDTLLQNVILDSKAGGIKITNDADTVTFDKLGWSKSAETAGAPAQAIEGTQITLTSGLGAGEQLFRSSESFTLANANTGTNAWDSSNNSLDFNQGASPQDRTLTHAPKNTSTSYTPKGGTPAAGALVFADDGLAPAAYAGSAGAFSLVSVATGSWLVTVASSTLMRQTASVAVTANTTTNLGDYVLTSTTTNGYVTGLVTDANGAVLSGISVSGPAGPALTGVAGTYALSVSTGTIEVVANPGNLNSSYVSSAKTVTVTVGNVVSNTDFSLSKGARLKGFATSNGTDPLPGLIVIAKKGGVQLGSALSGSDGYFTFLDLSTGTWTVEPQPDTSESSSPTSSDKTIGSSDAGSTLFTATFTISGALGKISGTVKDNSLNINTGVLVAISSATITDPPATINDALRTGAVLYYGSSSGADGKYSVSVPGGYTYNISAWYRNAGGVTVRKTATAAVAAGVTVTKDFTWP